MNNLFPSMDNFWSYDNPVFGQAIYKPVNNPDAISPILIISIFLLIVTPYTVFFVLLIRRGVSRPSRHRTATVLVLGDVGRSPRMMYHADSLSKHGWQTFLVGYGDTPPIPSLLENPLIQLIKLAQGPTLLGKLPWVLRAPLRVLIQMYSVIKICIWTIPFNTEVLLVQNPPSIPTLALAQLVSAVSGSRLIIDWHNTGYSILSMRVGKRSPLVKIAEWFEKTFGQSAFAHLFVTRALEEYLVRDWNLFGRTAVLHDRPPPNFRRTETMIQHELFNRLTPKLSPPLSSSSSLPNIEDPNSTLFTQISPSNLAVIRKDRPALIVSSTSWTADEDFSLLITALDHYQLQLNSKSRSSLLPKLLVIITGLGALRPSFEKTVAERERSGKWKDIFVRCVFLPARDYPTLLGCADLGVSLHSSSSGRDLPMKVVDMFGCGVPVLARKFECIAELVQEDKNGLIFETGEEMGYQLVDVLTSFPASQKLDKLRSYFDPASPHMPRRRATMIGGNEELDEWNTWEDNWDRVVYEGILSPIKR
ncbi:hypothetical protein IAR55_003680 [Kwoniella newhampshirensis]|uniref:Chitobiosyldiphosphodolichol beta-mannosyltransferase n=1 Tax=Kwoniella newhampshirensis TaxID=1651941 RepID=A0AAW0YZI8_9TREE